MLTYILYISTFLLSFCLVSFYKKWAIKHSIIDLPNERSSHSSPTPRGGGIAIVVSFYLSLLILHLTGHIDKNLFLAFIPGLVLAGVGFMDDSRSISPSIRLIIQFLCSGFALFFLGGFEGFFYGNLKWLWSIIALFGFAWFINLFNFLDGSDGYASMEAISVALILWYFTGMDILILLSFSVAGFLYWNWPKAKVFMGDSGSTSLGYILIVIGVYFHNTLKLNFSFWLIMTSLFWFDATITLIRRIINREKLSQAHKNHIYQRAILGGFSHLRTLFSGIGINILLFIICLGVIRGYFNLLIGFILTVVILLIAMKYVDWKFPFAAK